MEKIVIIGGGIAGLTCLNALLDQQISPLLIEGGRIGSPKMCGEFLAPTAVNMLKQWEIGPIIRIQQANFYSTYSHFNLRFQQEAGALMRSEAECGLSARAHKLGGRIHENTRLIRITPPTKTQPYLLYLESGEVIEALTAIFATGKFAQSHTQKISLPYCGIKLHVNEVISPTTLEMYSDVGAYFGVVPVTRTKSNITCLIKHAEIAKRKDKHFLFELIKKFPELNTFLQNINWGDVNWLTSPASDFTIKKLPVWSNAYWIGDAVTSFPPAIGYGFAHCVSSGLLAADFYLQKKPEIFSNIMRHEINKKFLLGKLMHHILLRPFSTALVFPFLQSTPWFLNKCLKRLGYL